MKKFETPEIEINEFAVEDVVNASSQDYNPGEGGIGGGMGM